MEKQMHPLHAPYVVAEMESRIVRLDELDESSVSFEDFDEPAGDQRDARFETPD